MGFKGFHQNLINNYLQFWHFQIGKKCSLITRVPTCTRGKMFTSEAEMIFSRWRGRNKGSKEVVKAEQPSIIQVTHIDI